MARIIMQLVPGQAIPYVDDAEKVLPPPAALAWQQLKDAFPQFQLKLNRLLGTQDSDQLGALIDAARNLGGVDPPELRDLRAVEVADFAPFDALLPAINSLPFVQFAYRESELTQPAVDPSDDVLASFQGYLGIAPAGIEAFSALAEPGGDGAGVTFLDIERGWNLTHEDLVGAGISELNQSVPGNDFHSTACLGVVLAQDNDIGVIGVAPNVRGGIASSLQPTLGDAFVLAVGFLVAGDVLLIEEQSNDGRPVEVDPHLAMLIRTLTLLGIIVVEPAGNGGQNLDLVIRADGTSLDRTSPQFFDSGAIVVGARHALLDRSRMPFSSFGNRVDCHAWGEGIVTTSSMVGPLGPYLGLNPLAGDTGFGGTSGARAIVAGCAVSLQGIARARGRPLNPDPMRVILSGPFNTPSNDPAVDRIGVMPDLKTAMNQI
jgi:hypothetical protein